jgi:hypothetical protein
VLAVGAVYIVPAMHSEAFKCFSVCMQAMHSVLKPNDQIDGILLHATIVNVGQLRLMFKHMYSVTIFQLF